MRSRLSGRVNDDGPVASLYMDHAVAPTGHNCQQSLVVMCCGYTNNRKRKIVERRQWKKTRSCCIKMMMDIVQHDKYHRRYCAV